jgi:agmatine deiminase
MAWPHRETIYRGPAAADSVRDDLVAIAHAVARFEPVMMVTHPADVRDARRRLGGEVEVLPLAVDDLWLRDSGPIFVSDGEGRLEACGFNFNGWGHKQAHELDGTIAERLARELGVPFRRAELVAEGGALELDGECDLLACASSIVNPNRNPGLTRANVEQALAEALGVRHAVWATGLVGEDITDYHVDGIARFVEPGRIVVQLPGRDDGGAFARAAAVTYEELAAARRADGRPYELHAVRGPSSVRSSVPDFLDSYVNFYLVNGGLITARFGAPASDAAAAETLAALYPGREVVQLDVDALLSFGGGIHCATQQQPVV